MKKNPSRAARGVMDRLGRLLCVKTIVTFAVTGVFAALTLRGQAIPDGAMTIITMVISFYFGTQAERLSTKKE